MIYPKFLKEKDVIGVTAPSEGCSNDEIDINSFSNAIEEFKKRGITIKETPNCRTCNLGRSSSAEVRAKEFESLFNNNEVGAVLAYSGGEFLIEMLPYVNFDVIKNNPKWVQGFSDPTGLLFPITTNLDIATIYSNNLRKFTMSPWHKSLEDNLSILKGNLIKQTSYDKYQNERIEKVTGLEPYNLDSKVKWKNITGEKEITLHGRMLGGCIDILASLVGTKFDNTVNFIEKYKEDGIIWFFDNCDFTNEQLLRVLWQLKNANWFKYAKGFIFGRSGNDVSAFNVSFEDSVKEVLQDLNVPIITDADISHKPPCMTIINGAIADIKSKDGKGTIEFELK